MGLDSYAFAAKTVKPNPTDEHSIITGCLDAEGDWQYFDDAKPEEISYWRKFNALHGWMENLYSSRGGSNQFNCLALPLYSDDLQALKKACETKSLEPVEGFCFGTQEPVTDEEYVDVLAFITKAEMYIHTGYVVYYDSWW